MSTRVVSIEERTTDSACAGYDTLLEALQPSLFKNKIKRGELRMLFLSFTKFFFERELYQKNGLVKELYVHTDAEMAWKQIKVVHKELFNSLDNYMKQYEEDQKIEEITYSKDEDDAEEGVSSERDEKNERSVDYIPTREKLSLLNDERTNRILEKKVKFLEEENYGEKSWTMKGEVSSSARPLDSLLDECLEFDKTARDVPRVTEEFQHDIEDIIKSRVMDETWDDPSLEDLPRPNPLAEGVKGIPEDVNTKKPTESLSKMYEREQIEKEHGKIEDKDSMEKKKEMLDLWNKISYHLNSMSNFYYIPKPSLEQKQVLTNEPTMMMEEQIPIFVSSGSTLAPEEIYSPPKEILKSTSEMTKTDRQRKRRYKKTMMKGRSKESLLGSLKKKKNVTVANTQSQKSVVKIRRI